LNRLVELLYYYGKKSTGLTIEIIHLKNYFTIMVKRAPDLPFYFNAYADDTIIQSYMMYINIVLSTYMILLLKHEEKIEE
jgi:hypothetical protein